MRVSGSVTDLAYGGLFVECAERPTPTTLVVIRIDSVDAPLAGVVRWNGERGVGIQFVGIGAAQEAAVRQLLAAQSQLGDAKPRAGFENR